jgi:gas vesicle protein
MSTSKVILGVMVGMAAGAVMGILTAPDSGKNTRQKISDKRQAYMDELKNRVNGFKDGFKYGVDTVKSEANNLLDQVKTKPDTMTKKTSQYNS